MDNNTSLSEMLKIFFGGKLFCTDGEGGTLSQLLFDASGRRFTHLVVKQGRLFGKIVFIPIAKVTRANEDGIWLSITTAEIAGSSTTESSGVALTSHTAIKTSSGNGTLVLLAAQPDSGDIAYAVAHGLRSGHATMLPAEYLTAFTAHEITVSADEKTLHTLPVYRSDRDLQREVEELAFELGFLHIDFKAMHLYVRDSILHMEGNISSSLRSDLLADQVTGVTGLSGIQNDLTADDSLANDIALAIGQDERTRSLPIGVYPQLGVVRISGSVSNPSQKNVAAEIASKFAGVREVINDLVLDPKADMLYVMSAPEGGESKDLIPGKFTRHTK